MNQQTIVYECSRDLAEKKISNSEWINTWNDGIKLEKGDSVRLLGSFVNEDGDSQDIQILEGASFTIEHKPYINADTVIFEDSSGSAHTHTNQYQMKIGDIASPAYATDSFGIEPPYWAYNYFPLTDATRPSPQDMFRMQVTDRFCDYYGGVSWKHMYDNNPSPGDSGVPGNKGYDYAFNDFAKKLGCYIDTSTEFPKPPKTLDTTTLDDGVRPGLLGHFNTLNLDHQYQIAHMCKLVLFPVYRGVYYEFAGGVFNLKKFNNADYLSVGDYISTYYISNYPVMGSATTSMDAGNSFGNVNWEGGPRSVVGKILAVNKIYLDVFCNLDGQTRSMEFQQVYVYDFVNPGSYKNENTNKTRPRHGSSFLDNGYQPNRNDNRNAGVSWNKQSVNSFPHEVSYMDDNFDIQIVTDEIMNTPECGLDPLSGSKENMRYEVNTSLSFLWSCRPTDTRPLAPNAGANDTGNKSQISSFVKIVDVLTGPTVLGTLYEDFILGATEIKIVWDEALVDEIPLHSNIIFGTGNRDIKEVWYYKTQGYIRIVLTAGIGETGTIGDILNWNTNTGGIYWYPRQYEILVENYSSGTDADRKWSYQKVNSANYNYWGAVVRMNPTSDNVEPYTPGGATTHRLHIPFAQQTIGSAYKVKHFKAGDSLVLDAGTYGFITNGAHNYSGQPAGNPNVVGQTRLRQNWGVSTGRGTSGNSLNDTAPHKPVPYNLTDVDGWGHHYTGKSNMINPQGGNSYNDSVISIHFQQPLTGSSQYNQANYNTPNTLADRLWVEDLLYIKNFKTEIKPKPGYYNFNQVANDINDQLHFNYQDYQRKVGGNTTVGLRERQPGVSPNVINGNFVHSYLPDITFGFIPLTQELYEQNTTQFNERDILTWRTNNIDSLFESYSDRENNDVVTFVNNIDSSIDFYLIPATHNTAGSAGIPDDKTTQLFRFNGAKLTAYTNTNSMDHQAPSLINTMRSFDILNTVTDLDGKPNNLEKHVVGVTYQTRTAFNNFLCGGCVKSFVGAVNPTFKIDTNLNRMCFEYLYTPYRPATDDTGTALTLVSGQAVPSAIIDAFGSGGVTDSLSGIYIRDLVASQIDNVYQPADFLFDGTYNLTANYVITSIDLWNTLGFTKTQLDLFRDNSETLPFVFWDRAFVMNNILFNEADLDTGVNATNPFYSYCSLVAPPLQFAVEVESDQVIADDVPLTLTTPFYLIGSDFPAKEYYGGHGTKLPVVGICSRQFSSFGYVFDLSESSVTYTIEENLTITSIHTKIYNNDLSIPLNLGDKSSVIYVITKANYYKQLNEQEIEQAAELAEEATIQPEYLPTEFYYPNPINYEAPLFYDDETDEEL